MLALYHGRTSVCSLKVRVTLAEKALNFDSRLLTLRGDQFEPQYLKLNPNAVVPTLIHDDSIIVESTVIRLNRRGDGQLPRSFHPRIQLRPRRPGHRDNAR